MTENNTDVRSTAATPARGLPVFRGWTVDERLREFRRMDRETGMVFLPFDSLDGLALLMAYEEESE
jgi:hypothetical protein